jgi:hypothetical protein
MRCKRGDLAVVTMFVGLECGHCGAKVTLLRLGTPIDCQDLDPSEREPSWLLPQPIVIPLLCTCSATGLWRLRSVHDSALRPIRDPGPDAIDETLSSLSIAPHGGQLVDLEQPEEA